MDAVARCWRRWLSRGSAWSVCAAFAVLASGCSSRASSSGGAGWPLPRFDAMVGSDGGGVADSGAGQRQVVDAADLGDDEPLQSVDDAAGDSNGAAHRGGDPGPREDAPADGSVADAVGRTTDAATADGVLDTAAPQPEMDSAEQPWQPPPDCAPETQQIYLLTKDYQLHAYLPQTKQLTYIGTLACPAEYATWPFSMGVDRKGVAWVMYSSGELFQVSTTTAQCQPTAWVPGTSGFIESGMGFAANGPAMTGETLYIANGKSKLGAIDTATLSVQTQGSVGIYPGWPELTGTGKGELWGFFPQSQPAKIARIDKNNGAVSQVKALDQLDMAAVKNWAFAHWGGKFLMFFQAEKAPSTSVYIYDPGDGSYGLYQPTIGLPVVGAGVSSCAPTTWLTLP